MPVIQLLVLICMFHMAVPVRGIAAGEDISRLYDTPTLEAWQKVFEKDVRQNYSEGIEPQLTEEAKAYFKTVKFEFPLRSPALKGPTGPIQIDPLFGYFYNPSSKTAVLPVMSLKFFYDLIQADDWLKKHECSPEAILDYMTMLKYRDKSLLDKAYAPLAALQIPLRLDRPVAQNPTPYLDQIFNAAVFFIVAHEVGHVVSKQSGGSSVPNEIEADDFAYEILARHQISPIGIMRFFMYSSMWQRNGADFDNDAQYRWWLARATHPLNGDRIRAIGRKNLASPQDYFPNVPLSDPRIQLLKTVGTSLIQLGRALDNLTQQRKLRELGLVMELPYLSRICRKLDIIALADQWWGTSIDKFPQVAALQQRHYSQGAHPSRPNTTVIAPNAKAIRGKWEPKELTPFAFQFTDKGLQEIEGLVAGKQDDLVSAMTLRYGKYHRRQNALGYTTYWWTFDKTTLQVTFVSFSLYPTKPGDK